MPYTTAVVRESLRFKPAVAGLFRQAKEDIEVGLAHLPSVWKLVEAVLAGLQKLVQIWWSASCLRGMPTGAAKITESQDLSSRSPIQ